MGRAVDTDAGKPLLPLCAVVLAEQSIGFSAVTFPVLVPLPLCPVLAADAVEWLHHVASLGYGTSV